MMLALIPFLLATPDIPPFEIVWHISDQRREVLLDARKKLDDAYQAYMNLVRQEEDDAPQHPEGLCGVWSGPSTDQSTFVFHVKDCPENPYIP